MSELATVRVAAVQTNPRLRQVEENRREMLVRLAGAAEAEARLVVFPECALTGYCFDSRDDAARFAEPFDGPTAREFADACARLQVWAIYGFLESEGAQIYNACMLVGPDGPVATYRKIHLPFMGVDRFVDAGDRPFAVYEAAGLRIGMHICYDGAFPETGRVLTLLGADLLVLPTNWPPQAACAANHMTATRAMENVVYVIAVDRVGEENGSRFIGRSSIVAPNGEIMAFASEHDEEVLFADIDPARARQKRLIRIPGVQEVDRIRDRRPEFYAPIVEPRR